MPYYLLDDQWADDPSWDVLSGGSVAVVDRLQAAFARLASRVSGSKRNGYCTEQAALRACHGKRKVLELLSTAVLESPPWLHRPGDQCDCLEGEWIEGYGYRIHNFLKRNPSRREYERNQAQKADLRDARLKQLVYDRDGGCCRYCLSGPLSPKAGRSKDRRKVLSHDHVDPDRAAGADGVNLVVACGQCNDDKGHRTPDEADMTLQPVPTEEAKTAWRSRGLALFDRPPYKPDQRPITDETATEHQPNADPTSEPSTDHPPDPISDPKADSTGEVRPENSQSPAETGTSWSGKGAGSGRVGEPVDSRVPPPPDTPRSASHPDIYHRRSRAPTAPGPTTANTEHRSGADEQDA